MLDIAVVRGRAFTPAERTSNLSVAIVSETAARALWPNADAVGQVVRLDPDPTSGPTSADEPPLESRTFTVVGVVRDVAGFRIAPFKEAVVYVPTSAAMPKTSLIARVHGDPELARQTLLNRLTTIDPDMARQVMTMRTLARMDTYFLQIAFWLTVVLGGLALALTLSGLFSVLSYLVEQRTREIGVRMALGATTRDVTRLVLSQSIRPVGVGLFIGGGSAAGLAALLLATPAAATIGQIVHVLDPVAYAGVCSSSSPPAWWPPRFRPPAPLASTRRGRFARIRPPFHAALQAISCARSGSAISGPASTDERVAAAVYFNAPASRLPTPAPPDFETNDVSTGTAFATMSGLSPSFENALAALARPAAEPAICDNAPAVPTAALAAGAALSSESMPGTALLTCENSSALRRDFATPNNAPAAPAACSGVEPISFESSFTRSGLALTAAAASSVAAGAFFAASAS